MYYIKIRSGNNAKNALEKALNEKLLKLDSTLVHDQRALQLFYDRLNWIIGVNNAEHSRCKPQAPIEPDMRGLERFGASHNHVGVPAASGGGSTHTEITIHQVRRKALAIAGELQLHEY